jgi:hypothetical protein
MELCPAGFRGSVHAAPPRSTIVVALSDLEQARQVHQQLLPRKLPGLPG